MSQYSRKPIASLKTPENPPAKDPLKELMDQEEKVPPKVEPKPTPPSKSPSEKLSPQEITRLIAVFEDLIKSNPNGANDGRHASWNKTLDDLKAKLPK